MRGGPAIVASTRGSKPTVFDRIAIANQEDAAAGLLMNSTVTRRNLFRAFRPGEAASTPQARVAQIGLACVEPRGVACRRCGEACDIGAIKFRLQRGGAQPLLDISTCTGCGDCASVCPRSAIGFVDRDRALVAASLAAEARA